MSAAYCCRRWRSIMQIEVFRLVSVCVGAVYVQRNCRGALNPGPLTIWAYLSTHVIFSHLPTPSENICAPGPSLVTFDLSVLH